MPLKTGHWIGIGGAVALLGYLLWPKTAKAATPVGPVKPATPATPGTPPVSPPYTPYTPYKPPPGEVTEGGAYVYDPTLWTETELEKKYAKGEDVSAAVAELGKRGYADGLRVGVAAGKEDVAAKKSGTLARPLGAETHPSLRSRLDDPNLANPYKEGFANGFRQAYDGTVNQAIASGVIVAGTGTDLGLPRVSGGDWYGTTFVPRYWKRATVH